MSESSGKALSPTEIKQRLGRTSIRRPHGDHQGRLARTTESAALELLASRNPKKLLTETERALLRKANPTRVDDLLRAGYTYEEISEVLDW